MKKILIAAGLIAAQFAYSQFASQPVNKTWYHNDLSTSKIFGVNTQNAYKFFESKGLKPKTVIVGVIDSGVEVDHSGLKNNMWVNAKEIAGNGVDDDKNGYVDDIHGWNFIGGKNGDVEIDNLEVTRVVRQYAPLFEGTNVEQNKANMAKMSIEYEMYKKAKTQFDENSIESKKNFEMYSMIMSRVPDALALLKGKKVTQSNIDAVTPADAKEAQNLSMLKQFATNIVGVIGSTPDEAKTKINKELQEAVDHFSSSAQQYDLKFDPRNIVGDNYNDYDEKKYGNNHYEGPDAKHGTHVAGIIAGIPTAEGQYGVASKVAKIMTVRAVPNGDERDKDIANAIRYAVDNGARVINMSFGKPVSPGKTHVWDAFKYAESKGVLLVKAAGNENSDIQKSEYFPTNFKKQTDTTPFVNNVIVVGASTDNPEGLKASFSNYNKKMVNVFAPGQAIYSTVPDNKYENLDGTSMASPVVAGASALLLAYMPNLTPPQIIEALEKTVNKSNASIGYDEKMKFSELSKTGGVIDVAKAAEYAYNTFGKNKNRKSTLKKVKKNKIK